MNSKRSLRSRAIAFMLLGSLTVGVAQANQCLTNTAVTLIGDCDPSCGFQCTNTKHGGGYSCQGLNACYTCNSKDASGNTLTAQASMQSKTSQCAFFYNRLTGLPGGAGDCGCPATGTYTNTGTSVSVPDCYDAYICF